MNEQEIYIEALERTNPADRKAFLDDACAGDPALRECVEHLIRQSDQLGSFLEHPPLEAITGVADGRDATLLLANGSTEDDEALSIEHQAMNQNPADPDEEIALGYLEPATRPGSLGRLGHYDVLNVVGKGAFGTVLRAFDTKLERIVAIKVMALEMASLSPARKRFLREARTSAQIRHENVVGIYSVEEKPIPYLVMEYIPGKTLQQHLDEQGPLSLPNVLRLGKQIADGLAAAHEQGLIHRDIKPGNILLEGGMHERVKVTDFGLARTADDASMTQSGMIAGTPMYMAPEQAQGHKLDHRADLFSLGSVLYQMLSGRPPFRAANTVAVLKRVAEDAPRPIQEIIPEVPTWMSELVSHLHAKNPEQRFQSAKDVSDLLATCLDDLKAGHVPKIPRPSPSTADPSEPAKVIVSQADRPPRRQVLRRSPLVRGAAAVVIVLGGLGITEGTGVTKLASIATRWTTVTTAPVVQNRPAPQSSTHQPQHTGPQGWPADAVKAARTPPTAYAEFSDADVLRIAALPAAEQVEEVRKALKARNPEFDGTLIPTFDGDAVVGLKFSTERVKDVSPVRALTKLTKLEAAGPENSRGLLTDLSVLKGLPLNDLFVAHNDISDLAPLRGMPIRCLFLDRNPVKDFAPLHDLPLRVLLINQVSLNTLKPLEGLKLEHLDCIGLPITDLSPLKGMPLKILMLASAEVSDLTPLTGMKLEYLNLYATKVSDLSPLEGMPLVDLHIGETQVTDLSPLKDIRLKKLFGDFLPTRDAAILREIKTLETINSQPAAEYLK